MSMYYGYSSRGMLPRVVKTLLIANAVMFVISMFINYTIVIRPDTPGAGPYRLDLLSAVFGLVPYLVNHKFMVWQFFTYMFLHGGFAHIFFNMFALWMFGTELEYSWGAKDFFVYYLVCGIGSGIVVWMTSFMGLSAYYIPTVGASGAIYGLLVAYGMMWPDRIILVFGILPMKALHFVIIFGALEFMQGIGRSGGNVAHFAHVGGAVIGFLYLKYWWRVMIYLENYWRRRNFSVHEGGRGDTRYGDGEYRDDTAGHPDIDEEVDRILDKIAREGMNSLTDKERRVLDRVSKRGKN